VGLMGRVEARHVCTDRRTLKQGGYDDMIIVGKHDRILTMSEFTRSVLVLRLS